MNERKPVRAQSVVLKIAKTRQPKGIVDGSDGGASTIEERYGRQVLNGN